MKFLALIFAALLFCSCGDSRHEKLDPKTASRAEWSNATPPELHEALFAPVRKNLSPATNRHARAITEGPIFVMHVFARAQCNLRLIHQHHRREGTIFGKPGTEQTFAFGGPNKHYSRYDYMGVPQGAPMYEPILPSLRDKILSVRLADGWHEHFDDEIAWQVFGDSAPMRIGVCRIIDLLP